MSSWKVVSLERPREGVALVMMSNPEIRNHVSWAGVGELAQALAEAREGGARIVVLASGVPGHWLEHAWLTDLHNMIVGEPTSGDGIGWFTAIQELRHVDVVSIAAVSGDCSGGGAELGWACDLRVAEEQATFSQPEVMIGLGTGLGGSTRLARLIGRTVTAEMVFDGGPMSASRLHQLGGVNRVVAPGAALEASLSWAARLAERPPGALRSLKQMLNDADERHLADGLGNEQTLFQASARSPEGIRQMQRIQERFDAGETIREVYGPPRD